MVQLAQEITEAAQASRRKWCVPASVTLAQFGLESGWGKKVTGTFNFFGIKARTGDQFTLCPTHEVINGKSVSVNAPFKNFSSYEDAFDYHGQLLATHDAYRHAMSLADHPEAFANALTGVYATDPQYGAKLIEIMRGSGLEKYDV